MKPGIVLEQPRKVTVVESIIEQIVNQIQGGTLNAGDRLPSERRLIEMLGVSRSSVREALQGLAMMGLVVSRPGQGTFVNDDLNSLVPDITNPSLSTNLKREMRLKLLEARQTIEGDIAYLAAERATEELLIDLRQTFDDYRQMMMNRSYHKALMGPHHDFHITLAEMTQNAFFVPVLETLLRAVPVELRESDITSVNDTDPDTILSREIELHRTILHAVEGRDGEAAREAIAAHMDFERQLVVQDSTRVGNKE